MTFLVSFYSHFHVYFPEYKIVLISEEWGNLLLGLLTAGLSFKILGTADLFLFLFFPTLIFLWLLSPLSFHLSSRGCVFIQTSFLVCSFVCVSVLNVLWIICHFFSNILLTLYFYPLKLELSAELDRNNLRIISSKV